MLDETNPYIPGGYLPQYFKFNLNSNFEINTGFDETVARSDYQELYTLRNWYKDTDYQTVVDVWVLLVGGTDSDKTYLKNL